MLQELKVQDIELTPAAVKAVTDILTERKLEGYALRVYLAGSSCCGRCLGMVGRRGRVASTVQCVLSRSYRN